MTGTNRSLAAAAIGALAGVIYGCTALQATPSPPNGNEQMPGPSYVHITGDPAVAATRLIFGYILPDGARAAVSDTVGAGATVNVDRTSQPGVHRLSVNDVPCEGTYKLEEAQTTEIVVHIRPAGCTVTLADGG